MEYSSNGKGNLGVTLGAIGTGLGVLNDGLGLLGNMRACTNNDYVTKEMLELQLRLIDSQKDNAILTADLSSEKKMVEVFNVTTNKINEVRDELRAEIRAVEDKASANAAAQSVINTQFSNQLTLNTSQIEQLYSLTKLVIPNSSSCPGWGPVTVTPTFCGTTIA